MDERERPPYLGEMPRDRRGNWPIYLLALGLLASLIGGWLIYANTAAEWRQRYNTPKVAKPVRIDPAETERQHALRQQAMVNQAAREIVQQIEKQDRSGWKCIDGTPFRPIPGGGWENVPGEWCVTERERNRR